MVKLTDDAFEEAARFVANRIKVTSQEISSKSALKEAICLLGPAAIRRRHYIQDQITRTVVRFREDANVDQTTMPSRGKRRESLDRLARGAHILGQSWQELNSPDRLRLLITHGPKFDEMFHAMDDAGVDPGDFLRCLEEAATAAAIEIPGKAGGAPKALATDHLAQQCLRLYCEFRKDGRSPGATRGGYPVFLRLVHELATDDEAFLEAAAKAACRAMKNGTGLFGIEVKDQT